MQRAAAGQLPLRTGYALFQVPFFFRGQQILTAPFVQAATRAGIAVHSWVIDEIDDIRTVVEWGVTGSHQRPPGRGETDGRTSLN